MRFQFDLISFVIASPLVIMVGLTVGFYIGGYPVF